jgi:hypothetical protein
VFLYNIFYIVRKEVGENSMKENVIIFAHCQILLELRRMILAEHVVITGY